MAVRVDGVEFDNLELPLRIYRTRGLPRVDVLSYFSAQDNRRSILTGYDQLPPLTVAEALTLPNAEHRLVALASFDPASILPEVGAELLDSQTVTKTQVRWDADLQPRTVEYDDTYELYRFKLEQPTSFGGMHIDIFHLVACECPSTARRFHLFVPPMVGYQQDAIAAVAWTMQISGEPLTKEQYLALMYAET